jgi:Spy/CpxP family protein refolding chaperone
MTNHKFLKAVTILLCATTIPFVGWSNARAQEDISTPPTPDEIALRSSDSSTWDEGTWDKGKWDDPEFKQALIKHHEKMFFKRVDATSDQQTKISKIFADAREGREPLRTQRHEQMKQMHELMSNSDTTDQQIKDQAHEIQQTEDKLKDQRLDTMLAVRAVLTSKQREAMCPHHGSDDCCEESGMHHGHKGPHGGS